jgi:predicted CXXCH cytochrome family protein
VLAKAEQARHIHAPAQQNCGGCHDAHASDLKYQLRQATPDLCLGCHKEIAAALASTKVVHGAATQAGGCSGCHAPHSSALPKLQRQTQPQQCLACHNQQLKTKDGTELSDFAELLSQHKQHHGPIRDGACTACHQPHAGAKFRLLSAEYPAEFYAPFKLEQYALCFGCHIPDLVLKRQGTGLTRFRNKDQNLHWLHVNQEKGRTCRACHEVHASSHPFHIRDAVPFGTRGWMLEINYEQTAMGGRCTPGCHVVKEYDHGGAARIPASAPPAAPAAPAAPMPVPATQEARR